MREVYDERLGDYVVYGDPMPWKVVTAKMNSDYTILLEFVDGKRGVFDMSPYLEKPSFSPLKSVAFFLAGRVEGPTVVWSDEIDIAPERLYSDCVVLKRP